MEKEEEIQKAIAPISNRSLVYWGVGTPDKGTRLRSPNERGVLQKPSWPRGLIPTPRIGSKGASARAGCGAAQSETATIWGKPNSFESFFPGRLEPARHSWSRRGVQKDREREGALPGLLERKSLVPSTSQTCRVGGQTHLIGCSHNQMPLQEGGKRKKKASSPQTPQ